MSASRWRLATFTIASAGVMLISARQVEACSHRCFTPWPMLVAPATGATDVPLKAIVHVHLEGGAPDAERWLALETFAGGPVDVTFELAPWSNTHDTPVRMIPTVPLAPRTTYRLRKLVIPLPTGTDVVGTFTTGDSRDDTPPAGVDLGMVTHEVWGEEICD